MTDDGKIELSWQNFQMSLTIGKLAEALAKAQGIMKNAPKDKENPFFHSKYADLGSVWDVLREPLSKHGLAVVQLGAGEREDVVTLDTFLIHMSGEWMRGRLSMKPVKNDPQGIGSCMTYARRYALGAICGVATETDDDGNQSAAPARGKLSSTFQPGDPTKHTDVKTGVTTTAAQQPQIPSGGLAKPKLPAAAIPKPPAKPPIAPKPRLGRPKPKDGEAVSDDDWNAQKEAWKQDPLSESLVIELLDYYGLETDKDLTPTQRWGFWEEMTNRTIAAMSDATEPE